MKRRSPSRRLSRNEVTAGLGVAAVLSLLVVFLLVPLGTLLSMSLEDRAGTFVGLANFKRYLSSPQLVLSAGNSALVALITVAIVVPLAFVFAYALTRTRVPFRGLLQAASLLPLFAPSLLPAISLVYLFGQQGLLKNALPGTLYGPTGIVLAESLYTFPQALLVLVTALRLADARLYDAAASLGASRWRRFRTVTWPGAKYGAVSAAFVVFTLVVTDFGIPKVIGGRFNVLATDAYKQVVGQQDLPMGAVVGTLLLVPAAAAFAVERWVARRSVAVMTARAVPLAPKRDAWRDRALGLYCALVSGAICGTFAVAVWASFVRYFPYDTTLTVAHYDFASADPVGWASFANSLVVATMTAVAGTAMVFLGAYLARKLRVAPRARTALSLVAMVPMAVPGLVLGLSFLLFLSKPWNPLRGLYGTLVVLAICTIIHFYTVAHLSAVTALQAIDDEFETVGSSLGVAWWRTFWRVTVPISMPAILDVGTYFFVSAMTTVSAVIFLYEPSTKLAAVTVVHLDEMGATAPAAAVASLLLATSLAAKGLKLVLERLVHRRQARWRGGLEA